MENKDIFIITGAHDTGKSSVLKYLNKELGYQIKEEAFWIIHRALGPERFFHNPRQQFILNDSPDHICPRCRPKELTELLLEKQLKIEGSCQELTILERGFCDYIAYLRSVGTNDFSGLDFNPEFFVKYKLVFLLEVRSELQEPKWGKSLAVRIEEARKLNELIFQEYSRYGFSVIPVPRGTVKERAILLSYLIERRKQKRMIPIFGMIDWDNLPQNLLVKISDILSSHSPLFRVTGSRHLLQVLMHGTDRAGFANEIHWREDGYRGRERKFEDVIYASAEEDILRETEDPKFSTAFKKIPQTQEPFILIYDSEKLEQVHQNHQYAFRNPQDKLDALLCILKVKMA